MMNDDKMIHSDNLGVIQPQMKSEVVLYQPDNSISLEVLMEAETVC